jgi:hypothetical protein
MQVIDKSQEAIESMSDAIKEATPDGLSTESVAKKVREVAKGFEYKAKEIAEAV